MKQTAYPIIILNWNGIEDTIECMESVFRSNFENYKVYLVDNGSDDNNIEQLQKRFGNHPKVELILNEENLGFTKGNNEILKIILNQENLPNYVFLLNNDTVIDPDWMKSLISSAKENQADMVSSKMIDYYERHKMDNAGHLMLNTAEIIPVGHGQPIGEYNNGKENLGACAGAALYSTKMLRRMGIFDERFTTGYEDAEIGIRATVLGYKCYYEPTAIVFHKMGRSVKKIFNYEYTLSIQKHILYSYLKLMPIGVIIVTMPSFLIKYLFMFFINILFLRKKYLKIMYQSLKETFLNDFGEIRSARKQFMQQHKPISSLDILFKQTFFLFFDIRRFYKYFILNKVSAFDTYGKVETAD